MLHQITLIINGSSLELAVESGETLLEVLRYRLGLTGTKRGCDMGTCGACTVIIDRKPILSCLTLAVDCHGKNITTIEGLAREGHLHPLQDAFIKHGAIQCGFCTPGMILSAKALLDENSKPSEEEIKESISGNICRCTGYQKILEAIDSITT